MLWVFEALLVVAIVLMSSMGPYHYPAPKKQKAEHLVTAP
jgi:hypothetical protein